MNADLEEQLKEMGPDYQAVVARLRSAQTVSPQAQNGNCAHDAADIIGGGKGPTAVWFTARCPGTWLAAASLLVALGLTVLFKPSQPSQPSQLSYGAHEYHLSPAEMIATQRPDGSWQNDFLTRRNAEVLANCETLAARIAYKKAIRNLRAKGIRNGLVGSRRGTSRVID